MSNPFKTESSIRAVIDDLREKFRLATKGWYVTHSTVVDANGDIISMRYDGMKHWTKGKFQPQTTDYDRFGHNVRLIGALFKYGPRLLDTIEDLLARMAPASHFCELRLDDWSILFKDGELASEAHSFHFYDLVRLSEGRAFTLETHGCDGTELERIVTEAGNLPWGTSLEMAKKLGGVKE